ncbi:hypothetical protein N2E09_08235 [Leuconostoc citreum]
MVSINFTMTDLQATRLGYEEGQDVTREVLKCAEKAYHFFHSKYLEIEPYFSELSFHVRDAFIAHDTSLEFFYNRAKNMVLHGATDSLDIFGCYLEYIDTYNELLDLIKNEFRLPDDENN